MKKFKLIINLIFFIFHSVDKDIMTSMLGNDDLNDFIKPSVACIKTSEEAVIQLEIEDDENKDQKIIEEKTQVSISLEDCLACSGCITSSEEILIKQHDSSKFVEYWEENKPNDNMIYVMMVSDQSRISLSKEFNKSVKEIDEIIIKSMKKRFQITYFVGVGIGREIGHYELFEEVNNKKGGKVPVLTSVCPGWRLYVEKTHGDLVEHLSEVKTPQWITGALAREVIKKERSDAKICVLSLMPCFDKKLEASRDDVVDFVVTPRELISLVDLSDIEFYQNSDKSFDYVEHSPPQWPEFDNYGWGGIITDNNLQPALKSGGWALSYIEKVCKKEGEKGGEEGECTINVINGKNEDIIEIQAVKKDGTVISRAGIVNGFKNIQNGVRKWKGTERKRRGVRGKSNSTNTDGVISLTQWDMAEVMACPGGCLNGGGQLPNKEMLEGLKSNEEKKNSGELMIKFAKSIGINTIETANERKRGNTSSTPVLPDVFSTW